MVIEQINGDIYGTSVGVNPLDGDTLCYPNHVGYSSDFNVMVNMGGACGDSSWVTAQDLPMISFHAPTDPFAPYGVGTVIVPGFNLPVVEVSGSYHVQQMANALGLNDSFAAADNTGDIFTAQANLFNDGYNGLYPLNRPLSAAADSAPWEWWNADNPNNANGLLTNPDMSMEKGMAYLDTIQGYAMPRIMCALNLPGNPCETSINVDEVQAAEFKLYPNPTNGIFTVSAADGSAVQTLDIYDIAGRRVMSMNPLRSNVTMDISDLPRGVYTIQLRGENVMQSMRIQRM
jgi:hypothetical protein